MEYPYRFSDDEKYNIAEYVWEKEVKIYNFFAILSNKVI